MDTMDNMISLCEMPRIGKFTETVTSGGRDGSYGPVGAELLFGDERFWK